MPRLIYAPSPPDNPLKGLVPYAGAARTNFPHSMEFHYLPVSAVVVGPDQYDWKPLEQLLNSIAGRGHQAVFRFFLEYPNQKGGIPPFLEQAGLKVLEWNNTNTQPLPPATVRTPDYENADLRRMLQSFIAALGKRYDGDARIGFITAGLLGTWGEWHDYPRSELFASPTVQKEVMDAYEKAFRITPVLLRYPRPAGDRANAANDTRPFGYHDDSFAWATLDTGKKGQEWYFLAAMRIAGPRALAKWKTQPIGGEIRPEAWGKVFDAKPDEANIQDFHRCVEETHATWLMDSGMFNTSQSPERVAQAIREVRRMGYEFHVSNVTLAQAGHRWRVRLEIENRGVAPFYYDWPAQFGILAANGVLIKTVPARGKLPGLLPGGGSRVWEETLELTGVPGGAYKLLIQVPNPLPNGAPLRFANQTQDADRKGWLTLLQNALVLW